MKHYRRTFKTYAHHAKQDRSKHVDCNFCDRSMIEEVLEETDTMMVIRNRVKYDLFDGARVLDHLLIVPKVHRQSLAEFTNTELLESFRLAGKYENEGYGVYARGRGSVARSMPHQHTHLLQLADRASKFMVFTKKPYILIER